MRSRTRLTFRPQEKPKPVPPPAPEPEAEPVVAEEDVAPVPKTEEEAVPETIEAFGDAPAAEEVEEQAAALPETAPEPETTAPHADHELLAPEAEQEPEQQEEFEDPAIAGSGGTGSLPAWAQQEQQATKPNVPEPLTTYTGPPGFGSPTASKGPIASVQAQAPAQPRSNSRAAQRYKNADGQGVVLPKDKEAISKELELTFGTLSFGGENGPDGTDVPEQATPAKLAAQLSPLVSPPRALQPPSLPQPTQQAATPSAVPQPPAQASYPYLSQQSQPGYPQSQQTQQQPQHPPVPHHVTLQQQAQTFQNQYLQQHQPQHQPQQSQDQSQAQQNQYYRQNDFYGSQGHESAQAQQQQPQQPTSASYDSPFGFGQQSQQHLYGQAQQQPQQQQPTQTHDLYSTSRQAYDSYAASGYPRPADEQKQAAPAPSHTPTAPAQQPQQGLHQQQNQYYGNMGGYYQGGPAYNPYYQCEYLQAPQS